MTVRGKPTRPAAVSARWRGRTPDPSIPHKLEVGTGHAQIPEPMLRQGLPDLGVLVWAQLRLWFDDRPGQTTYRELADALGMAGLSDKAAEQRLWKAVSAMRTAGLIKRARVRDNQVTYQVVVGDYKRWAVVRRRDIAQLSAGYLDDKGHLMPVTPAHLCDFARWQLECRDRGWSADTTAEMASRWSVSERTFRNRRDALHATGLIKVIRRSGHPDLVWLGELFDTHWMIPSEVDDEALDLAESAPESSLQTVAENEGSGSIEDSERVAENEVSTLAGSEGAPWQKTRGPYKESLPADLSEGLSDSGGASATPLTSPARKLAAAAPQAAPSRKSNEPRVTTTHNVAGRLIGKHRYLVQAPPRFRAAMVLRLTRALDAGLDERHLGRALARVVGHADRDAHCELVRLAVQQAWADQRSGMCPECAGDGRNVDGHAFACTARLAGISPDEEDPATIKAAIATSLESARAAHSASLQLAEPTLQTANGKAGEFDHDPLQAFLEGPAAEHLPDWTGTSDEQLTAWLMVALARLIAPKAAAGRVRALQRAWSLWRTRVPLERHEALDTAALQLRLRLEQHALLARSAS